MTFLVILAQKEEYRDRAVYKLKEIAARGANFAPDMIALDLDAVPGN